MTFEVFCFNLVKYINYDNSDFTVVPKEFYVMIIVLFDILHNIEDKIVRTKPRN